MKKCDLLGSVQLQRGASLLVLLLLLIVGSVAMLLSPFNWASLEARRMMMTQRALAEAKVALVSYAATDTIGATGVPAAGRLPCQETPQIDHPLPEGSQLASCNILPVTGRLAWRSLKLEKLLDGYGEPLWYALSAGFRKAPINSTTQGQLRIDNDATAYAAIIIAPGPPLAGQSRPTIDYLHPPQISNYLEGGNQDGDYRFSATAADGNDRLLGITSAELMAPIIKMVLASIAGQNLPGAIGTPPAYGLRYYYNTHAATFPFADTDQDGYANPGESVGKLPYRELSGLFDQQTYQWLSDNSWFPLVDYRRLGQPNRAEIAIGTTVLLVYPCTQQPCL